MILDKISYISTKVEKSLRLGVPCCNEEALILLLLNVAITDCLSKTELEQYNSIIKTLTFDCKTSTPKVRVNSSNKELWEELNPECINRKQWERIAYKICNKYKLDISSEKIETICNIAFDITKNIIDCKLLSVLSLHQKLCELNIFLELSKDVCKIQHSLLIEKYPTCDISLKDYITLIKCNYSFDMISEVYDNNCKIEIDKNNVMLITSSCSYNLNNDLKFAEVIAKDNTDCKKLKIILEEYNINNNTKNKILNGINFI